MNFQVLEFQQFKDDLSISRVSDFVFLTENVDTFFDVFKILVKRLYYGDYIHQRFQVIKVSDSGQKYHLSQKMNLLDILDWVFSVIKNQGYEIREYSDEFETLVVRDSIKLSVMTIFGKD